MTGRSGRGRTDRHSTAQHGRPGGRPARDGGASQIVVIGIIGAAALLMIGFLTIPMIVGGSSLLFSAGTGGFGCSGSAQQAKSALQSKVSGDAKNSIPSNYLSWYQKVGQQYGVPWVILAGIGTVESGNGQSTLPGVHSGSNAFGAAGPMQIGIGGAASNNWGGAPVHPASEVVNGVATDEDGDGIASVYDPADAIAGTAKILLAHGVLSNVSAAIFAYNHLESYVQAVESYASTYASGGYSVTAAVGSPAASTAVAIPSLQALRRESLGVARRSGEAGFSGIRSVVWPFPCRLLGEDILTTRCLDFYRLLIRYYPVFTTPPVY